ncbi:hypothetical protein D3C87_1054720 [compost metagenome]
MPAGLGFHVGNPFAFHRIGDDAHRLGATGIGLEATQQAGHGGQVMAIDHVGFPAESDPFVRQRLDADDVVDIAVELVAVAVDDRHQLADFMVSGAQCRFPDLPFLHLAVAEHHVGGERLAQHPSGQRHAQATGQGMADGTGRKIHPRHFAHVRVVAQRVTQARVVVEDLFLEETPFHQHRKQADRRVPLAHHETVAIGPFRLGKPQVHHVVIQRGEQLGGRKHRGVVADLGDFDQPDGFQPNELGLFPQPDQLLVSQLEIAFGAFVQVLPCQISHVSCPGALPRFRPHPRCGRT